MHILCALEGGASIPLFLKEEQRKKAFFQYIYLLEVQTEWKDVLSISTYFSLSIK